MNARRPLTALLAVALAVTGCAGDDDRAELERLTARVAALEAAASTTTTLPVTTSTSTTTTLPVTTTTAAVDWQDVRAAGDRAVDLELRAVSAHLKADDLPAAARALDRAARETRSLANLLVLGCPNAAAYYRTVADRFHAAADANAAGDPTNALTHFERAIGARRDAEASVFKCANRDRARQ